MKKLFLLIIIGIALNYATMAQAPQIMNYQPVVRNAQGRAVTNTSNIALQFIIHDQTPEGNSIYLENASVSTNAFGLFTYEIGITDVKSRAGWRNIAGKAFFVSRSNRKELFINHNKNQHVQHESQTI